MTKTPQFTNTAADATAYLKAVDHPFPAVARQIMMFWRGIITLEEFTAATGITDSIAAIHNLDAEITAWLMS